MAAGAATRLAGSRGLRRRDRSRRSRPLPVPRCRGSRRLSEGPAAGMRAGWFLPVWRGRGRERRRVVRAGVAACPPSCWPPVSGPPASWPPASLAVALRRSWPSTRRRGSALASPWPSRPLASGVRRWTWPWAPLGRPVRPQALAWPRARVGLRERVVPRERVGPRAPASPASRPAYRCGGADAFAAARPEPRNVARHSSTAT